MRLIDADALKEALSKRLWFVSSPECDAQEIKDIIDNAPTVDLWEMRQEATENALKKAEVLYARPQGKWIEAEKQYRTGDGRISTYTVIVCSECGEQYDLEGEKFCPHCGADMRPKPNQLRDCENCVHHSDNGCEVWECEFEKRSDV
jgi:hypothetical protein